MEHIADCLNNNEDGMVCLNGAKSCPFQINTYFKNYYFEIKCLVENTLFNRVFTRENKRFYSEITAEENNNVDEILNANNNLKIENEKPHEIVPAFTENVHVFKDEQDENEISPKVTPERFKFDEQYDLVINDILLKREAVDEIALQTNTKKFKFADENDDTLEKSSELVGKKFFNPVQLDENVAYVPTIPLDIDEDKANTTNLKYLNRKNNCTEVVQNNNIDKIQTQTLQIDENIFTQHTEPSKNENNNGMINRVIVFDVEPDNVSNAKAFNLVKQQWSTESPVDPVSNLCVRYNKKKYTNIKTFHKIGGDRNKKFSVVDVYTEHLNYLQETLNCMRRECQNLKDVHFRSKHLTNRRYRHVDARIKYLQQQKVVFHENITKMKSLIDETRTFYMFYENQQISEYEKEESNLVVEAIKDFDVFYGYFDSSV